MKNKASFANLLAAVEKAKNGTPANRDNENYWRCMQDKAGNGFAIIRFLPAKTDDDIPFVKTYSHGFQGPTGKWFIDDCPTTIEQNCPVCDANGVLWATGIESDKEIVRKRKRKTSYIANVLIVSDPKNPDNEGKVKLFKFGSKIFDKIKDAIDPPKDERGNLIDPDDEPMNPFDPDDGANFKLKIRKVEGISMKNNKVEGYSNFDKSEFDKPSKLDNWDSIKDQLHDLNALVDPKKFKSYDDLEKKFNQVWNGKGNTKVTPVGEEAEDEEFLRTAAAAAKSKSAKSADDTVDQDLEYFIKLAAGEDD
jgi:hypothetical protein